MTDLFPETIDDTAVEQVEWAGSTLCKYGHPLVRVRLISVWHQHQGWQVGWFAQVDNAVDEWHPKAPRNWKQHATYPWYRLEEMPTSKRYGIACGNAARAVKIVLEQMKGYCGDAGALADVTRLQDQIEVAARAWLLGET